MLSPKEAMMAANEIDPSQLPEESTGSLSSLPESPSTDDQLGEGDEFTKLSVYSPTQEQFSMPEDIANEAISTTTLPSVSDVQGAKHFSNVESEYSVSSTSEPAAANYFGTAPSTRSYSYLPSTISPSSLISPSSTYTIPPFNPTFAGTAESGLNGTSGAVYPNTACMSPTAYMSPYGTSGKQYTWPTTPNGVNYGAAFGMTSHDLMQNGYAAASYQPNYSQVTRSNYPAAAYFPSTQMPATTSPTC